MSHSLSVHLLKGVALFPFLAIANEAAIRIDVRILVGTGFHFCRVSTRKLGHWVVWQVNVDVYERLPNSLPKGLYSFPFPAITWEHSSSSHPQQYLVWSVF